MKKTLLSLGLAVMTLIQLGCSGPGQTGAQLSASLAGKEFTIQAETSVLGAISTGGSVSISAGDTISFGASTFTIVRGGTTLTNGTWVVIDGNTIRVTAGGRTADCDISLQGSTLLIAAIRSVSGSTASGQAGETAPQNPDATEALTGNSFTLDDIAIDNTTYNNAEISFTEGQFTLMSGGQVLLSGSWTDLGGGVIEINASNIEGEFCIPLGTTEAPTAGTVTSKAGDTLGSSEPSQATTTSGGVTESESYPGTTEIPATQGDAPSYASDAESVEGSEGGSMPSSVGSDDTNAGETESGWCDGIIVIPGSEAPAPSDA